MIVSNDINVYNTMPFQVVRQGGQGDEDIMANQDTNQGANQNGSTQRTSRVITAPSGDTVMQYTNLLHSGAIMRKNVTLHQANAFSVDPMEAPQLLRRRSEAYEGMMLFY